ncbi:MAG: response regulator [Alkalimonas sp.]|nr:response regulator [Alkalimonas sp.]
MNDDFSVLFLDDDGYMLNAYQRMLRGSSFQCVFEQSCLQAQNYLCCYPVSLLLVDYLMPKQSGLDFCRHKTGWKQPTDCYLLSAMHEPERFKQAEQQGIIKGVLSKPITKTELLLFLDKYQHKLSNQALLE